MARDPARDVVIAAADRPVFIGGCPRSGTTLLGAMVHAHPDLAVPPETRFFFETYGARRHFGDLRAEANRRAVGEWITTTRKTRFKQLKLPKRRVVEAIAAAPPTIGSLSCTVLAEFARQHDAARWGDKRPHAVEQLDVLFRLVPDAQFVHIVRDPRGCVASLKRLGWWGWGVPEALHKWRSSVTAGLRARRAYRPDQYVEVRYEDLVADPESQLRRLAAFLGVQYVPDMAEHQRGAALINKPYHDNLAKPIDPTAVESWRRHLTPEELALVEREAGDLLDGFGYERLGGLPPVPPELRGTYRRWSRLRAAERLRHRVMDAVRRLPPEPAVAARLTSAQRRLAASDR